MEGLISAIFCILDKRLKHAIVFFLKSLDLTLQFLSLICKALLSQLQPLLISIRLFLECLSCINHVLDFGLKLSCLAFMLLLEF